MFLCRPCLIFIFFMLSQEFHSRYLLVKIVDIKSKGKLCGLLNIQRQNYFTFNTGIFFRSPTTISRPTISNIEAKNAKASFSSCTKIWVQQQYSIRSIQENSRWSSCCSGKLCVRWDTYLVTYYYSKCVSEFVLTTNCLTYILGEYTKFG